MNCKKCNVKNPAQAGFCNKCGANLKRQNAPSVAGRVKQGVQNTAVVKKAVAVKKEGNSKSVLFIVFLVIVAIVLGVYTYNRMGGADNNTGTSTTKKTSTSTKVAPTGFSVTEEGLPIYPGAEEMPNPVEGGEVRSFNLDPGTTPAEVMAFYEEWLDDNDWEILIRDADDGQIDALSINDEKMRVWVYFTGSVEEDIGMTFFLNYSPAGGGSLPPIPVN